MTRVVLYSVRTGLARKRGRAPVKHPTLRCCLGSSKPPSRWMTVSS